MSTNVYDILKERGFLEQETHAEVRDLLGKEKVTFYIGFDATADSLTAGHFLTIMAMKHMQNAGHRPIALLGVSAFLSQKIVFHPPVAGAKWIQSAWRTVAIQHEGNKALGRDGFTGTILSPEKQFSILKLKIFFIIQPEVHKPYPVHFPTVIHSSIPPLKSCG